AALARQCLHHTSGDPRELPPFPTRRSSDLDEVDGARSAGADARRLLLDRELHAAAFVDLRRDLEARADLFALNRLERIHGAVVRSEEHTSELQSRENLVCRLLLEKKKQNQR